jgi:hypothetical protein
MQFRPCTLCTRNCRCKEKACAQDRAKHPERGGPATSSVRRDLAHPEPVNEMTRHAKNAAAQLCGCTPSMRIARLPKFPFNLSSLRGTEAPCDSGHALAVSATAGTGRPHVLARRTGFDSKPFPVQTRARGNRSGSRAGLGERSIAVADAESDDYRNVTRSPVCRHSGNR